MRILIRRSDGERVWTASYEIEVTGPVATVLDALFTIQEQLDPTLAFRYSCRNWMCGSCGVVINGREGLACHTRLTDLRGHAVTIEPLRHLPVIRDLVVDFRPFFAQFDHVASAFAGRDTASEPPSPMATREIDRHLECITCGLCYSACPMVGRPPGFVGPAALNRAYTLQLDPRDQRRAARARVVQSEHGVWRCHAVGECTRVCPKGLDPREAIQRLKTMWQPVGEV